MIRFILNLIRRRRQSRQRKLFAFFDGHRMCRVDPIQAHIDFQLHPDFDWDKGEMLDQGDPGTTLEYAKAACDVFGLKKWDSASGTGLTISELVAVLEDFLAYCDALKKNTSDGLTSQAPTGLPSSPTVEADPPATTS